MPSSNGNRVGRRVKRVTAPVEAVARFVPLEDRVLVRLDAANGVSRGGIHLPGNAQHSMTGVVEGLGPKVKSDLVVGDRVHFTRFAGATGDEIEPGLICVMEAHLAGVYRKG